MENTSMQRPLETPTGGGCHWKVASTPGATTASKQQVEISLESLPSQTEFDLYSPTTHNSLTFKSGNRPTVLQACHALVMKRQSVCVLIDDCRKIKGLLTAKDIVRLVLGKGINPARVLIENVMQRDIMSIVEGSDRGTLELRAVEVMIRCHLDYLVVTDASGRFARTFYLGDMLNVASYVSNKTRGFHHSHFHRCLKRLALTRKVLTRVIHQGFRIPEYKSNCQAFPATATLAEIAHHLGESGESLAQIHLEENEFVICEESVIRAVTLGYELSKTLAGEAIKLLNLPSTSVSCCDHDVNSGKCLSMMHASRQAFLAVVKSNQPTVLISKLEATRLELNRLHSRRVLRTDLLRHLSFRRQISAAHLLRMPSGKTSILPLSPRLELPVPSVRHHIEKAEMCVKAGDYNGALLNLTQYLQQNPHDGHAYLRRGMLLQTQLQSNEEALKDFRRALDTKHLSKSQRNEALTLLCTGYLELGRFPEVERLWSASLIASNEIVARGIVSFSSSISQQYLMHAQQALEKRAYEKALESAKCSLAMGTFHLPKIQEKRDVVKVLVEAHLVTAICLQRINLLDEALLAVRKALDLDSTSHKALQMLHLVERACELDPQVHALTRQMGTGPSAQLYVQRALLAFEQGCFVRAFNDVRAAVRLMPSSLNKSHIGMLACIIREGDELRDFLANLIQGEQLVMIDEILGELTSKHENELREMVLECLRDFALEFRRKGQDHFSSMQFRAASDEISKAINLCEQFLEVREALKDEAVHMYVSRAGCFVSFKEHTLALQDCDKAIGLNPLSEKAWIRKCNCLYASGDSEGFLTSAYEARRLFGEESMEIVELVTRAQAIVPDEAVETATVCAEDVFDSISRS